MVYVIALVTPYLYSPPDHWHHSGLTGKMCRTVHPHGSGCGAVKGSGWCMWLGQHRHPLPVEARSSKCHLWAPADMVTAPNFDLVTVKIYMVNSYQSHTEGEGDSALSCEPTRTDHKCNFSARHGKPFFQIILVAWKLTCRIVMQPEDRSSYKCRVCPVSLVRPYPTALTQETSEVSRPCHTEDDLLRVAYRIVGILLPT